MQFGAFCPMMRSHGTDAPREIYQFGKKGEKIYDAIEKSITLRYSLLPYIYSASWDVTAHQSTMMRALVMDFANDRQALDINDEYMFGKSLLVCPVTNPMYSEPQSGKDTFSVARFQQRQNASSVLAGGCRLVSISGQARRYTGGQTLNKKTPIDIIPLYVKAGSILSIGPESAICH